MKTQEVDIMRQLKRSFWYKFVVLFLVLALIVPVLAGCGVAQDEYDTVVAERDAAKAQVSSLQSDLGEAKSDLAEAEGALATAFADPVEIDTGFVSGTVLGDVGNEVRIYRGIPYAAPPVGDLRWKPPQPAAPWSGIRECTQWSNRAAQVEVITGLGELSEDCLYLNVLTPAKKTTERFPVMVWFHGGGLSILSGNSPGYCNTALPQHGVVVVTVNHRLGALGYLSHPLLTEESGINASGNYGQLDLIAALEWVQNNIAAFGGDPNNVTIFGESGGGAKTHHLMVSPLAKGLFHRAIIQSGVWAIVESVTPPLAASSLKEAEEMGEKLAAKLGVAGEEDVLAALRALSWQEIVTAATGIWGIYVGVITVDGWSLPDTPENIFQAGRQNDVPFIIGCNSADLPGMIEGVADWAPVMSTGKSKGYAYVFTHVPTGWREEGVVAFHGLEVPYVFGRLEGIAELWNLRLPQGGGAKQPDPGLDEMDDWVAEAMMTMWAQFAATGDPNIEGFVEWPAYEAATDQYLDIGDTLQVKSGILEAIATPSE